MRKNKIAQYVFYVLVLLFLLFLLFLLGNYTKIKTVIEKQGLADIDSDYIEPEIIRNILTDKQNSNILEYASTRFVPSQIGGGLVNTEDHQVRNSQTAWVPKNEPIVKDLFEKICNKYNLKFENAEDLQVVKYEKDNFYREHHDSFPFYEPDFLSQGGHRELTCLIYLTDNFEGGETNFPNLNLKVKPMRNCAVVFRPLDKSNKKCHPKALHAGMPVISGTKYICNLWIRETPYQYEIDTSSYEFQFNKAVLSVYRPIATSFERNL
jgi:prolyl 4-hydroxylase